MGHQLPEVSANKDVITITLTMAMMDALGLQPLQQGAQVTVQ